MRNAPRAWVAVVCLAGGVAAAAPAQPNRSLSVRITSPDAGIVDGDLVVTLVAEISDPRVRTAVLAVNGASYPVPVEHGRIEQAVIATPGVNRVGVSVDDRGRSAHDSVTFTFRGQAAELVVLLGWEARGQIIDLWVREPDGETCKWDHRETESGGFLSDFSTDAIGFGSQAYVLPEARPGRYRVKIHYWSAEADDADRSRLGYDELLRRLDEAADGAARAAAARRLDAWASPAAPQTPVHAEAVLFPGTPHERRWRFDVVAQRTGQLHALGELELTDEMIRAARASRGEANR